MTLQLLFGGVILLLLLRLSFTGSTAPPPNQPDRYPSKLKPPPSTKTSPLSALIYSVTFVIALLLLMQFLRPEFQRNEVPAQFELNDQFYSDTSPDTIYIRP